MNFECNLSEKIAIDSARNIWGSVCLWAYLMLLTSRADLGGSWGEKTCITAILVQSYNTEWWQAMCYLIFDTYPYHVPQTINQEENARTLPSRQSHRLPQHQQLGRLRSILWHPRPTRLSEQCTPIYTFRPASAPSKPRPSLYVQSSSYAINNGS